MPTKPAPKFTATSYSRLGVYTQCPHKAKLKFIERVEEPVEENSALTRGAAIHKLAEDYVKGTIKELPEELKLFKHEFSVLLNLFKMVQPEVETQWAFSEDWTSTDWFGKRAWFRMVLDLCFITEHKKHGATLHIIDYKTGKVRDEQRPQLELYALGGLLKFPTVKKVVAEFWYLDHGELVSEAFEPSQLGEFKKGWTAKTEAFFRDRIFAPRPSIACRWCYYSKTKAALCQY